MSPRRPRRRGLRHARRPDVSWTLLLLLSPFFLLVLVFGLIVVVALVHARPEDIPTVLRHCTSVFSQLVTRLPEVRPGGGTTDVAHVPDDEAGKTVREESP